MADNKKAIPILVLIIVVIGLVVYFIGSMHNKASASTTSSTIQAVSFNKTSTNNTAISAIFTNSRTSFLLLFNFIAQNINSYNTLTMNYSYNDTGILSTIEYLKYYQNYTELFYRAKNVTRAYAFINTSGTNNTDNFYMCQPRSYNNFSLYDCYGYKLNNTTVPRLSNATEQLVSEFFFEIPPFISNNSISYEGQKTLSGKSCSLISGQELNNSAEYSTNFTFTSCISDKYGVPLYADGTFRDSLISGVPNRDISYVMTYMNTSVNKTSVLQSISFMVNTSKSEQNHAG